MSQDQLARQAPAASRPAAVDRWLALGGLIGPLVFVVAFTVAGLLRPGYSPIDQTVSDLGIGGNDWIVNGAVVLVGLSLVGFAIAFYRAVKPWSGARITIAAVALLAAVGVGFAAAGIVPETNRLHYAGALLFFVSAPVGLLIAGLALRRRPVWGGWARLTLLMSLVTVILIALTFYTFSFYKTSSGPEMIGQFGGLMERIVFVEVLAWYAASGWRLFRRSPGSA
jgi:hypothetical membrane protein